MYILNLCFRVQLHHWIWNQYFYASSISAQENSDQSQEEEEEETSSETTQSSTFREEKGERPCVNLI